MSGKKPSNVQGFKIVREFRGTRLYLASVATGRGMRWLDDASKAMVIPDAQDALAVSERASREWGAKVTVVSTDAEAHLVERSKTYRVAYVVNGRRQETGIFRSHTAAEKAASRLRGNVEEVQS